MAFRTLRIDDLDPIAVTGLRWHPVRHALGIQAFGINAYSGDAGDDVIEDHTEEGSDHQELYVVLAGRARFELDGEPLDAPAGTLVFLPDPPTRRHAVAEEDGTTVLALGGKPDHEVSAWEWRFRAQPHIDAEEWEKGVALMHDGLAALPGDGSLLFNLACFEARLGRLDDAAQHLNQAVDAQPDLRASAAEDPDLEALRERSDFPAMTVAVISDVHGNAWALDAVLADARARGATTFLDLGDTLDGPLDVPGTADRLMALGALTVRGNHDRLMLEGGGAPIRPEERDWLATFPSVATHEDLVLFHAQPHDDLVGLLDDNAPDGTRQRDVEEIAAMLDGIDAAVILCGHTHVPRLLELPDGRWVLNPGSVGLQAYREHGAEPWAIGSGSPHARYALLHREDGRWRVEPRTVVYDWATAGAAARAAGNEDWAVGIETGWPGP